MDRKSCVAIVPVYRSPGDAFERMSFKATCSKYRYKVTDALYVITYDGMDLSEYEEIASSCGVSFEVSYFPKEYFQGIHGYNLMMLGPAIYRRFEEFEYMLICQLDAMILGNDLQRWTEEGYDYIGGPISAPGCRHTVHFATVGNGGFCLRKISAMLKALGEEGPLTLKEMLKMKRPSNPKFTPTKRLLYTLMVCASGRSSRLRGFISHWVMEDMYFSFALQGSPWQLRVPSPIEASRFALDLDPDFWYRENGNVIPFGAHKFGEYYDGFYKNIIQ